MKLNNDLTFEECEEAFEIELESLEIISKKVQKAFEEERKMRLNYKRTIQPRLSALSKQKKYGKILNPTEA